MKGIVSIFAALFSISLASAQTQENYGCFGWSMMSGYGFGFMWIFGFLVWILVLVALVLFIIWLIRQLQQPVRKK